MVTQNSGGGGIDSWYSSYYVWTTPTSIETLREKLKEAENQGTIKNFSLESHKKSSFPLYSPPFHDTDLDNSE